ncbi:MAG: T9SS type A sorting domain-containing protein [Bacteroidota bacterium]
MNTLYKKHTLRSLLTKVMTFAVILTLGGTLYAQKPGKKDPATRAEHRTERMQERLGLSETQAEQVRAIHLKYGDQLRNLRHDDSMEPEARHTAMKEIRMAKRSEIEALLTEEQLARRDEMRAEHKMHRRAHGGMKPHKMHRKALKDIKPLLKQQRAKLEPQLSQADREEVASLRAELRELRKEFKPMRQLKKSEKEAGNGVSEETKAQMKDMRAKKMDIMTRALVVADRYQSEIAVLHAEIAPELEAAKAKAMEEMKAKRMERFGGEVPENCEKRCEKKAGKKGKKGDKHANRMEKAHRMALAHFILMNPKAKGDGHGDEMEKQMFGDAPAAADFDVFPNPAANRNSIRYSIAQPGSVRIELTTLEGRLVRVLSNEHHDAGTYTLDVDTGDLAANAYFYRIVEADGKTRVKRFTITK